MPQKSQDNSIRADKYLSSLGLASRRNIDQLLRANKIEAGGIKIVEHGQRIPKKSVIKINGMEIKKPKLVYYLLNKPKGIVSTASDEFGRKNVVELIKSKERIFPIGRLDRDTHGLIILTNDGNLTNLLIHPKFHIPKTYKLKIKGDISQKQLQLLREGILLDDGKTQKADAIIIQRRKDVIILNLTIYEGKKRQIRRMCEAIKLNLVDLQRIKFGKIELGDLKIGEFRELSHREVESLKKLTS